MSKAASPQPKSGRAGTTGPVATKLRAWDMTSAACATSERVADAMMRQFRSTPISHHNAQRAIAAPPPPKKKAEEPWWNTRPDPVDFRDVFYEPRLTKLEPWSYPEPLSPRDVRDQGFEGSCTGQALAAAIDMQNIARFAAEANVPRRVSARMLYESARAFDEYPEDGLPGSSLRGALKAFFHNGVCDAALSPYLAGDLGWRLTVPIAKDARRVGLGAYFRLRHVLNHYHAALNEAQAIFCSALIHRNWLGDAPANHGGQIDWNEKRDIGKTEGMHAFAIVGYDQEGFIVLNSWGPDWGGCTPSLLAFPSNKDKSPPSKVVKDHARLLPGMARWSYADWRANVVDAWAFRLTAPTALPSDFAGGAFQAAARTNQARVSTVPASAIRGHYLNLDDGLYVDGGNYPNTRATFEETGKLLKDDANKPEPERYKHLLFYAHGGLNDLDAAAARAGAMTPVFKHHGIYPIFYLWHTGGMESLDDVVRGFVDSITMRTRGLTDLTDMLIEKTARPIGKALWDEMKLTADRSGQFRQPDGSLRIGAGLEATALLLDAARERKKHPLKVHFVGHSAGAILLGRIFTALTQTSPQLLDLTGSVSLFAPACTTDFFEENLQPMANRLKKTDGQFTVYNLGDAAERADQVARIYRKSLLYLVSNSFETDQGVPLAGMTRFWDVKKTSEGRGDFNPANVELLLAKGPEGASASTTHGGFDNDPVTMNHLLNRVLGLSGAKQVTTQNGGFSLSQLGQETV